MFEQGLSAGRTVDVEITGPDVTKLVGLGGQVLGQVMPLHRPSAGRRFRSRASTCRAPKCTSSRSSCKRPTCGSTRPTSASRPMRSIDGAYVSDYYLDGKKIDLTVMGEDRFAKTTQDIAGAADRHADGPARAALGRGRRRARQRTRANQPPRARAGDHDSSHAAGDSAARRRDGSDSATRSCSRSSQSGQLEGGYHINLAGTADKLRDDLAGAAVQHSAGLRHHLPADGRAVRVVALSVRDHSQRAARRGGRRARACC